MAGIFGYNSNPLIGYGAGYGVQPTVPSYGPVGPMGSSLIPTMQPQPTPQSFTPQSNIIWVNGEEEIANYPSGRGWQQLFGDKNKPMFYIRETDLNGVTQPIRRLNYSFEDTAAQAPTQTQSVPTQAAPVQEAAANAVSREEFDKLTNTVSMMAEKLSDLLK